MVITTPFPRTISHTTLKAWLARRAWLRVESIPHDGVTTAAQEYMKDVLALYKRHPTETNLFATSLADVNREFFLVLGRQDLIDGYEVLLAEVMRHKFVDVCLGKLN